MVVWFIHETKTLRSKILRYWERPFSQFAPSEKCHKTLEVLIAYNFRSHTIWPEIWLSTIICHMWLGSYIALMENPPLYTKPLTDVLIFLVFLCSRTIYLWLHLCSSKTSKKSATEQLTGLNTVNPLCNGTNKEYGISPHVGEIDKEWQGWFKILIRFLHGIL